MSYNHTIKPTTINILGNSSRTPTPSYTLNTEEKPKQKPSLWERIKSGSKKVLEFIKDTIVPIVTATAALLNAWTNYRRCTGKARDAACYA